MSASEMDINETDNSPNNSEQGNSSKIDTEASGNVQEKNGDLRVEADATSTPYESEEEEEGLKDEAGLPDLGASTALSVSKRCELYKKGSKLLAQEDYTGSVQYFMACLRGLKEEVSFPYLPHCLRDIAAAYKGLGEYDKAIPFVQAEKMYFETALINSGGKTEENGEVGNKSEELKRADQLERLSRLCFEKEQVELALEYCGKATKIRQKVLGNDHAQTIASLDFFTVLYAEAAKLQYKDTLQQYEETSQNEGESSSNSLRQRRTGSGKRVRFKQTPESEATAQSSVEYEPDPHPDDVQPSRSCEVFLWLLVSVLCLLMVLCLSVTYCSLASGSPWCRSLQSELHYWYVKARVWYKYWSANDAAPGHIAFAE